jgi:hypothetical protein
MHKLRVVPLTLAMWYSARNMSWSRIALATVASGFLSSLTDWLFMGDWLYKRYDRNPEIWRYPQGAGENKAILWSSVFPFLTCGVFVLVCSGLHLYSCRGAFKLAAAVWLIGPLPLTVVNALWVRISAPIAASFAVGWLVKLILAALAVGLILR